MAEALWQWDELVRAAGGTVDGATPTTAIAGFSIDTRTLQAEDVFVALKDVRDGHDFVGQAFAAGAATALVSTAYVRKAGDGPLIRVADPLRALEGIARAARARLSPQARVIAVTGSVGKTGTTAMLRACLERLGATHAPEKSFNNHWGVPLTLARMPRWVRFAVIEIGMNHAGEITPLTKLTRPHVALVTTVEPVHLAHFDSVEAIADAKAEIFGGLEPGGTAVINRDNAHFERLAGHARGCGARMLSFGRHERADITPTHWEIGADGSAITIAADGRGIRYMLAAPGEHLAMNSLGVVAAMTAAGLDIEAALPALRRFEVPQGRGARVVLSLPDGGKALLIDESYNANPASMRAALMTTATVPRTTHPRRVAVLGEMLELGVAAGDLHVGLAEPINAAGIDLVFTSGPNMRKLFDALPAERRTAWSIDTDGLIGPLLGSLKDGDLVMIKGSNGARSWRIAETLRKRFAAVAA